ncbi:uncharacterized protein LOC129765843 [Toxorhynchites rutilus septentrionalis]|uniref:uncharacterized protein LOC129765843 n=1 Tax=Toxorhynchites rutilus septentrionalis TaxID=329112 RepID=UPI0024788A00|nr:uncharacterized protein LOC129765843 [Toxorhynchites rutilus septentrionalis]
MAELTLSPEAAEKTGYNCAACERPDHAEKDMVFCDQCQNWYHFGCAGVTNAVKDDSSWICGKCMKNAAGSSVTSELEQELKRLEEEKRVQQLAMEKERVLHKRRLELQQEMFLMRKKLEQEKREMELAFEKEQLEKEIAEEESFQKKSEQMRKEMHGKLNKLRQQRSKDFDSGVKEKTEEAEVPLVTSPSLEEIPPVDAESVKGDTQEKIESKKNDAVSNDVREANEDDSESSESNEDHESVTVQAGQNKQQRCRRGPTKAQLSARQFLSKKLPVFSGKLEDWPMFICSYETSSEACGFSNVENLARLQECLKGQALEAVRSRLLLPDAVPQIIETLRMLYGRPEHLLNMLLVKVRKALPPRADRLITFINFGMIVQQLADHLEATKLTSHLLNPMLIQEITEKLPASTQLEWVRYRRRDRVVTIRTLANFLSEIVKDASEVTSYCEAPVVVDHANRKSRGKDKEHEGFLHAHCGQENANKTQAPRVRKPCMICDRTDHRVRNCVAFRNLSVPHRLEAVRKWKLCSMCLNEHGNARCKLNFRCNVGTCREPHHPLLHAAGPESGSNCNFHSFQRKQSVIFRMIPVTLHWGNHTVNTVAFLDEGSSYTLVEKSVASALRTNGVTQPLRVTWTAGMSRLERNSQKVELYISARGSSRRFHIKAAHTVDNLRLPQSTLALTEVVKQYPHLQDLSVVDFQHTVPQILIGLKDVHLCAPLESRIGKAEEPIAVRSKLGWTIFGPVSGGVESSIVGHHACSSVSNEDLHDLLKSHYTLEESGISVALLPESEEDRRAKDILTQTTVRVGDRFETGLLWRYDSPCFPDSYPMAVKRLKSLERRLLKDNELYDKVRCMVSEYLTKGYAHKASELELADTNQSKVWYLPLNVVINPKKPGKVRLVWDAAAAVAGVSLNSKLLKGPDMLTALPAVICKFREKKVGFGADIKEMYHQLKIRKEDKQAQRFLFRENPASAPEVFIMDVATFGATSSPCSAQFVKNMNAKEFAGRFPEAARAILENHYVDDYFDSTETVEEAVKLAKEVTFVHSKGGFELRNWVSSSEVFLREMGETKENQCVHFNQDKETGQERVLGIVWNSVSDEFTFSARLREDLLPYLIGERRPTKRGVMSCIMSLFDPIGFLASFTIYGKMLIQDLWRSGCAWDQQINDECSEKWNRWVGRLPEIERVRIPRYHFTGGLSVDYSTLQLHVLVDASENAYGAVAYFRVMTASGPICSLVMARSKVAPLKQLSIPRLELQAAVLGSRLLNSIIDNHSVEVKQRFIWTDSRTVLSWIHSDQRRYKQFVAFRIGEILSLTKLDEWRWVSTRNNIADDLTKWDRGHNLNSNGPWFRGPHFLFHQEDSWPEQKRVTPNVPEEIRAHILFHDISLSEPVIDPLRFSRWKVLVRTIACVYRFVSNCKRKKEGWAIEGVPTTDALKRKVKAKIASTVVPLQRDEYQKSEAYLWRFAQAEAYGDEVKTLQKNLKVGNEKQRQLEKSSSLYSLSPFLDAQNVLRMEGRTAQAVQLHRGGLLWSIDCLRRAQIREKVDLFVHVFDDESYSH